jgi:hypothetical protein
MITNFFKFLLKKTLTEKEKNFISKNFNTKKNAQESLIESVDKGMFIPLVLLKSVGIREGHPTYEKMKFLYEEKDRIKREELIAKYGKEIADKIINRDVWEGMTLDMLVESHGDWSNKSESFSNGKLKVKYFYDYSKNRLGNAAYDFEVSTEDGIVVGWKDRRTRGTKNN